MEDAADADADAEIPTVSAPRPATEVYIWMALKKYIVGIADCWPIPVTRRSSLRTAHRTNAAAA